MPSIPGKHISFWIDSTPEIEFSAFVDNLTVDVAIVGAGLAGLTAATLLKRAGKTVAVIEARRVASGVSGHTTAKLTSLHRLIYSDLIEQDGEDKARLYGESNQAAIERVAAFIHEEQIDCDFQRKRAFTFAESEEDLPKVEAEAKAAIKLGLPASFVTQEPSLPFPIVGAVKFDDQAQFHVRKYLLHLAQNQKC